MGPKILLCDKIEYAPVYNIASFSNGTPTFKAGKAFRTLECNGGTFTEELQASAAGDIAAQKLDANAEITIAESQVLSSVPQVFRLSFSDGTQVIWGNLENAVNRDRFTRVKNQSTFTFTRKALALEF